MHMWCLDGMVVLAVCTRPHTSHICVLQGMLCWVGSLPSCHTRTKVSPTRGLGGMPQGKACRLDTARSGAASPTMSHLLPTCTGLEYASPGAETRSTSRWLCLLLLVLLLLRHGGAHTLP